MPKTCSIQKDSGQRRLQVKRPASTGEHIVIIGTDAEGYLLDPKDWSEDFAIALAEREGLRLTPQHWCVIRYLRGCFSQDRTTSCCCDIDAFLHFRANWPRARGQPRWFPGLFPKGGLTEQGHRLAGLPRAEQAFKRWLDA